MLCCPRWFLQVHLRGQKGLYKEWFVGQGGGGLGF